MKSQLKYAVVFAGQGAQKPGMGKSLYEASSAAREVFDLAGEDIKYDCFEADADRLMQTEVTQPAVYTMDMAAYAALREALGIGDGGFPEPSAVAGFSLGEYAAFTAAGAIGSLRSGLELVRKRSLLMKEAGRNPDGLQRGTMAACLGTKDAALALVEKARGPDVLEAVNFNSPQQTVIAGDEAAVTRCSELAGKDKSLGVRVLPLPVSGAFHSPIMRPAAEGLAKALEGFVFNTPGLAVYLNVTGGTFEEYEGAGLVTGPDTESGAESGADTNMSSGSGADKGADADAKVKAIMVRQIQSPVQWQRTIEAMAGAGIEAIIEAGPGKTLTGLVKKTAPGILALHVEDTESLRETVAGVIEAASELG